MLTAVDMKVALVACGASLLLLAGCSASSTSTDAGALACYTLPGFSDCALRCIAADLAVIGASGQCAERACACGFGTVDLAFGCGTDADCQMVAADCCGCQEGGTSVAVLTANASQWVSDVKSNCGGGGANVTFCPTAYLCGQAKALCRGGRCVATTGADAGT